LRGKYSCHAAGHDLIRRHAQTPIVRSHPLRIEHGRNHPSPGYELLFIQIPLLDHILQADLLAYQYLGSEIDGKSLRKLVFIFRTMGGDEEAYHSDLLAPSLAGQAVLEQMILKHEGIQELMISLILNLNAGDGEYGNYVLLLHTLAVAILIEAVG